MTLAKKIKKVREAKGMTQKQVAALMGISQQAYGQYESGTREPKPETIKKIAKALECKPYDLYPDDLKEDAIRFFIVRGLNASFSEDDPQLMEMYGRIQRKLDAEEAKNIIQYEKSLKNIGEDFSILNSAGKEEAAKRVHELTLLPEYNDNLGKK